MTSVLLLQAPDPSAPDLAGDFQAAGFQVLATGDCANLVRDTLRAAPDVLVCWMPRPDAAWLSSVGTLLAQQSLPVIVFTQDAGAELMRGALAAGVHAWVVQGYAANRLRPLVHLAQAREAQSRQDREALAALRDRLEERKWVDKAKGILMRAQQVSEEQAFQLLRTASMDANQKVGQLSRQVIDAARVGEAVNRAGQQRMLSQRLVKLFALAATRTEPQAVAVLMRESMQRGDDNLAALAADLSVATYGDLIASARSGWQAFRTALERPDAAGLTALDSLAEVVLAQSDALVQALESSGLAGQVGVVNVSGRQRMLSQRVAKLALLAEQPDDRAAAQQALREACAAFDEGMARLADAPLSTPRIRAMLEQGATAWAALQAAVAEGGKAGARVKLAGASEELLEVFDRLTAEYQHSIQVLMGS